MGRRGIAYGCGGGATGAASGKVLNEHGNDFVVYSAVEKYSSILVLWHFWSFLSFGCL